jgi:uncharacterized protein
MRILLCSDIHDDFERFPVEAFPDADLCLVAGDLTNFGQRGRQRLSASERRPLTRAQLAAAGIELWQADEITRAADWLTRLAERFPVYWIPGNHDINVNNDTFGSINNCTGILDTTVKVAGLFVHGVSMAPCYDAPFLADQWDYMTADETVEAAYYDFEPVDIVVSHSPPYGHRDVAAPIIGEGDLRHIGSRQLLHYILRYSPKFVVCGHVHEAAGQSEITTERGSTTVYNVAGRWQLIELDDG